MSYHGVVLTSEAVGRFAPIHLDHPPDCTPLTPASAITLQAVTRHEAEFAGLGIDWGCGTGCVAIVLAKNPAVRHVVAIDIKETNVRATRRNAEHNAVGDRITAVRADSLAALGGDDRQPDRPRRSINFVVANPPASLGDDGFSVRRRIATEMGSVLRDDGRLFVQISQQYGIERIRGLAGPTTCLRYDGVLETSDWVPFDLGRSDLRGLLQQYAVEEARGGIPYRFRDPRNDQWLTARDALTLFSSAEQSPLTQWQVHCYTREAGTKR